MYMKYIFLCEGGMHLLITGFASIGYLHGKGRLGELSFEFDFVCRLWLWYFLVILALFFDVSAVDSVKKVVWKRVWQSFTLSWVSYQALPLPHRAVGGDCGSFWSYSLTFYTNIFYTVLESGAERTTELSLMMSSVICMSSKRNPDYESDTEMNI